MTTPGMGAPLGKQNKDPGGSRGLGTNRGGRLFGQSPSERCGSRHQHITAMCTFVCGKAAAERPKL